jgi:ureidoglycolate lyase
VLAGEGRPGISVMRATPYRLPMEASFLERHPLSSQAFMPLQPTHFFVVVAPPGPEVDPADIRAFVCRPGQGVNYAPGVWHHPLLAIEPADFLVVDRIGAGPNCDEFHFPTGEGPVIAAWRPTGWPGAQPGASQS